MAVYRLTKYPRQLELDDGTNVTLRPMVQEDVPALIKFFAHLPEGERFFLKEDVLSPSVIENWAENLDYDRALPLLALKGPVIVGDSVLFRHRGGFRQHLAGIRVSVSPELANTNLVKILMRDLLDIAWDAELEMAELELVEGPHESLIRAADALGAVKVATIVDGVKDCHGDRRNLIFVRIPLGSRGSGGRS